MYIFLFLVMMIALSCIIMGIDYLYHQGQETKMSQWQSLAKARQLTFTPGIWTLLTTSNASVHGKYRDCQLALTTVLKGQGKYKVTYTQVSVRSEQRGQAGLTLINSPWAGRWPLTSLKPI